ncbi:MAG: hypothetical protein OHK0022_24500 [Roseiflexaceae bacterium]
MKTSQLSIIAQVRRLLLDIVRGDGRISGSVYDTAQFLRWSQPSDPLPALRWLLAEQEADGGWGDPYLSYHRQPATLAAVLALLQYQHLLPQAKAAAEAGVAFLKSNNQLWNELPDDVPVGIELILPKLLAEASAQGIELPKQLSEELHNLGVRRKLLIEQLRPGAATTATHCWEAWGVEARPEFIDQTGGVGHSPAATSVWLHTARHDKSLDGLQDQARIYLLRAAHATKTGFVGVVPPVWPNYGFETIFGLFALYISSLLDNEKIRDLTDPMLDSLSRQIEPHGTSFSPFFTPDGDDTATAMIVLHNRGYFVRPSLLTSFMRRNHFATWQHELHMSISTTAHAIHALTLLRHPIAPIVQGLLDLQHIDGYWCKDKWHASPYYTTSQAILALRIAGQNEAVQRAIDWLLAQQREDGGWGMQRSTKIETAYAVLSLHPSAHQPQVRGAIKQSCRILLEKATYIPAYWIAKVPYTPYHVDRLFELSAAWVAVGLDENMA